MTATWLSKSRTDHPIDGDGDGWVLDGTPQKRPATPEEMAAGAKWRASRGVGSRIKNAVGGAVRRALDPNEGSSGGSSSNAPQTPQKPAAIAYDHRIDLYHRAMEQAIQSKDPRLIEKVQGFIETDKGLKEPDRLDLHRVFHARRDGLPDPKPVRGSNRDQRRPLRAPAAKKTTAPKRTEGTDPNALARQQREQYKKPEAQSTAHDLETMQREPLRTGGQKFVGSQGPGESPGRLTPQKSADQHKVDVGALHQSPQRDPFNPDAGVTGDSFNSPAGKALEDGQRIEDLKDTTGLLAYIADNPDQFDVKLPRVQGMSAESMIVKDKDNGRLYFFKLPQNNSEAHAYGDGINEYMAPQIGNAAVPDLFPNVDFVGSPEHDQNFAIRADHVTQFAKDHGIAVKSTAFTVNGFDPKKAAEGEDKKMLALHVFDYLANVTDRHDAGMSVITDKKGEQHVIPFDNGSAFHSYDPGLVQDLGFPKEFADSPENIDYQTWLGLMTDPAKGSKGVMAHAMASSLYVGNEDRLKKDAEDVLKQMHAVPLDQLIADLRKRFPNLSTYEDQHLEGMARIWKSRLGKISADDVVKGMTK